MKTNETFIDAERENLCGDIFRALLPELEAIPVCDILTVNLDVSAAVSTVLGTLPEVQSLREEMLRELPALDITCVDRLEEYAHALLYAQARCVTRSETRDDLMALAEEGMRTRTVLYSDATALCCRGLIDEKRIADYKGLNGYRNIASDIHILVSVMLENWEALEGKCPAQRSELERAWKVANGLLRLIGLREQAPAAAAKSANDRGRAYTLFIRAYDEVRRGVTWLRWRTRDADDIAPSLYAGRKRRRADASQGPAEPAVAPTPIAPEVDLPGAPLIATPRPAPAGPFVNDPGIGPLRAPTPGNNPFLQ
jgi:hypothetical protein